MDYLDKYHGDVQSQEAEKYRVEVSNRFATLKDLDAEVKIIVLGK
jgi:hypothetical protein